MKVTMKFEGGLELAQALNKLPTRVSKRVIREALERAGEPMRADMARRAPRAPGAPDIADNMVMSPARMQGISDNDQAAAIKIGPEKSLFYGLFQEFGTIHHGAQPFARPAFDAGWQKALDSVRASFWTALAAAGISRSVTSSTSVQSPGGGGLV